MNIVFYVNNICNAKFNNCKLIFEQSILEYFSISVVTITNSTENVNLKTYHFDCLISKEKKHLKEVVNFRNSEFQK